VNAVPAWSSVSRQVPPSIVTETICGAALPRSANASRTGRVVAPSWQPHAAGDRRQARRGDHWIFGSPSSAK
jgi:hypothetical protein